VAASAPEAVAEAEVVITMLSDGPVVHQVVFDGGVADAMRRGAARVDMSSIPPNLGREHARLLASKGLGALDAPVSGGTIGAAEGTLAILRGGDEAVVESTRPVLEVLGRPTHVGPPRSG